MSRHDRPARRHSVRPRRSRASRVFVVLGLILAAAFLAVPAVMATQEGSVGVSPAKLEYTDPPLIPGGTREQLVQFQQRYDVPVDVHVSVGPYDDHGDAQDWIALDRSGDLTLAPGMHPFRITISVPTTAADGLYNAAITFRTAPPDVAARNGSSATAEGSVTAVLLMEVDNENQVKQIQVDGVPTVHPTEVGAPLRVSVPITNTGNVDVTPRARMEIQDKMQTRVVKTFDVDGSVITPGQQQDQTFAVTEPGLEAGQYWLRVSTLLDDVVVASGEPQPFDVLQQGELARNAELQSIRIDGDLSRLRAGQLAKMTAIVRNIGEGSLVAEFEGEVHRDGVLIDTLRSRPIEIAPGESGNLTMMYTPDAVGKYEIKGRVYYGSKVTAEKSLLFETQSKSREAPALGLAGAAVVALAAVAVATQGRRPPRPRD